MKTKCTRDEQLQLRAERQKRGEGFRDEYTAWFQVKRNDFKSHGRSHREPSDIMDRRHQLLSDYELHALARCQLNGASDIREQKSMSLSGVEDEFLDEYPGAMGTLEIAGTFGVKHPQIRRDVPRVMTTDLLVTGRDGKMTAVYVKPAKPDEASRKGVLLEIEIRYWAQRGVRHVVFTEDDIDELAHKNIEWLKFRDRKRPVLVTRAWLRQVAMMARLAPMGDVIDELSRSEKSSFEELANRLKFALLTGKARMDLSTTRLMWSIVWPDIHVDGVEILDAIEVIEWDANRGD
jgi:hypothetical protein